MKKDRQEINAINFETEKTQMKKIFPVDIIKLN